MEDFREENDLCVRYRTAARFNIGENLRRDVASKQSQFGGELFSRPMFAVPKPDYVSSN